ncbi:sialidase [Golovinomyces cichoracearum]|uniref:Sialidase n=1 Tax=Golovinomyces cichoracearum TaxID=62708 RepID=A0A420JB21_9PEZI|nr:sialidase [Golovinomyces cichoracearum]
MEKSGYRSRSISHKSSTSCESLLDPTNIQFTMSARSPIQQNGPFLLPKIRAQDQLTPPPTKRCKSDPSITSEAIHYRTIPRRFTLPENLPSKYKFPSQSYPPKISLFPLTTYNETREQRRASSFELGSQSSGSLNISTYQAPESLKVPVYDSPVSTYYPSVENLKWDAFAPVVYDQNTKDSLSLQSPISFDDDFSIKVLDPLNFCTGNSLMNYLTSPNPTPVLVRQITMHVRDIQKKYFWWDIRQIRPWSNFNLNKLRSIPYLNGLLHNTESIMTLPTPSFSLCHLENEADLRNMYSSYYAVKLNAALSLSQGSRHLLMRQSAKNSTDPCFISNYTDEFGCEVYGKSCGRIVGLVKSFDRWNSGMRNDTNPRKVKYLRGLAHLHQHMREHKCRYGFIITEIEIAIVRNGVEDVPHFGYLEIQVIKLAANSTNLPHYNEFECVPELQTDEEMAQGGPKMTALLALWYLHMLASDEEISGQVRWKIDIGYLAEGTRRKCLPKDDWIPMPQVSEKRDAKRNRGWIWPEEPVTKKELLKKGIRN